MLAHTPSGFFFWQAGKGPYLITIPIRPPPHSSVFCLCSCPSFCCYWTGIAIANATATAPAALAVSAAAASVAAVVVAVAATVVAVTARVTEGGVAAAESSSAVVAVAEIAPASASRVAVDAAAATVAGAWHGRWAWSETCASPPRQPSSASPPPASASVFTRHNLMRQSVQKNGKLSLLQ